MSFSHLAPVLEIARLQRIREAACVGAEEKSKASTSVIAAPDWLAEVDARLQRLQVALRDTRAG
jgi:hypothetical protein